MIHFMLVLSQWWNGTGDTPYTPGDPITTDDRRRRRVLRIRLRRRGG